MAEKKKFISVADTPAVRYWDYGRNAGIDPATVASKSGKKFWWICCDCGQPHQKVAQHEQDSQRCRLCGQKYGCRNAMPTRVAKTHSVADDPIGKYWDYERNVGIDPATVAYKSNSVYWWICSKCGKPHQRTATNEQKSTLCQECGREKGSASSYAARVRKTHSIADDPIVGKCWDYERNTEDPTKFTYQCNRKFWWICPECGESFQRAGNHMHDGQLCDKCAMKRIHARRHVTYMQTAVSIADDPIQSKYWDYERNPEDPHDIPFRSNGYYYWICPECGKSYKRNASYQYVSSHLCNDCADKARLAAHAATRMERSEKVSDRPNLLAQWDYEKNDVSPDQVLAHAITNYWWKCPMCGKSEQSTPDKKYETRACFKCGSILGGKKHREMEVLRKGSFGDLHPHLAKEWHPTMNGDVTPYDITSGCSDYFYWQCKYGHVFQTSPSERVKRHAGCPTCKMSLRTSFTEQAIAFYLSKTLEVKPHHKEGGFNFDIFIPSLKYVIEYDGMFWHAKEETAKRDKRKDKYCKKKGWHIIRVKEADKINKVEGNHIYAQRRNTDYVWLIGEVCKQLGILPPADIDIDRDTPEIYSRVNPVEKPGSLQEKKPELLKYWNYEANNPVKPDMVAPFSHLAFSWHCPDCGHEWTQRLIEISNRKISCPKCRERLYAEKGMNAKGQYLKGRKGK